jgi:tetratricopeptide (TPR) repeat protein
LPGSGRWRIADSSVVKARAANYLLLLIIAAACLSAQNRAQQASARNNRGVALMSRQNFEAALTEFKAAGHLVNQGIALVALGRLEDAERTLLQILSANTDDARAHYNLGLIYRSQGKIDDALRQFEEVRRLAPDDPYAWYFTATIQQQRGDFTAAADNFLKTIELDASFTSAYFGAARAYTALQQLERARIYQDRFQALTQGSSLNAAVGNQYGEQGPLAFAAETDTLSDGPATNIDVRFSAVAGSRGLQSSGSAMCVLDADADGRLDLFLDDAVYRNRGGRFEKAATLRKAANCAVGDYDNDELPDLFLTTPAAGFLYHNARGRFTTVDFTAPGAQAATFVDLDHDGWIDLVSGEHAFRNKADGTFSEVSLPLAGLAPAQIVPTDFDNDRDIDLLITSAGRPPAILSNNRDGSFQRLEIASEATDAVSAVVLDLNKDSWMDYFVTRPQQRPVLLRNSLTQRFSSLNLPLGPAVVADRGAAAIDFDNDGFIDLLFVAKESAGYSLRLLRNMGAERFEEVSERTRLNGTVLRNPRSVLAFDADNDGDADILVAEETGAPIILRNDGGNRNGSLRVTLRGFKDNKLAIGTKVEVHGQGLRQKMEVAVAGPLLFGTGRSRADFVRLLWPTGVVQDELPENRRQVSYQEIDRKGSSCPTLYTWDGRQFRFITDVIGPGVIGEWVSPGEWNASDTDEYVRLNPDDLALDGGSYRVKVLSQMEEVTYLDAMKLVAIDSPADVDVYPNDRYQPVPPYPQFKLWHTRKARPPVRVTDDSGADRTAEVARIDGVYAPVPAIANYPGFARLHSLIIDLGALPANGAAQLILRGFTQYFDSTTARSAFYSGIEPAIPSLEVADGKGGWIKKNPSIGLPAGLPKTIVVDVTGMFPAADHRVRIVTNMEIYWDQILVNTEAAGNASRTTLLPASRATLGFAGYPLELRKRPEVYDYQRRAPQDAFRVHAGNYTRYGDVTPLMQSIDDMFAIMASGDEITFDFEAAPLPSLPDGWHRTFLVYADGFQKAMETYTPFPNTVEPLPFHGMSRFPYPAPEQYPNDEAHLRYRLEFNTRRVASAVPSVARYRR